MEGGLTPARRPFVGGQGQYQDKTESYQASGAILHSLMVRTVTRSDGVIRLVIEVAPLGCPLLWSELKYVVQALPCTKP